MGKNQHVMSLGLSHVTSFIPALWISLPFNGQCGIIKLKEKCASLINVKNSLRGIDSTV